MALNNLKHKNYPALLRRPAVLAGPLGLRCQASPVGRALRAARADPPDRPDQVVPARPLGTKCSPVPPCCRRVPRRALQGGHLRQAGHSRRGFPARPAAQVGLADSSALLWRILKFTNLITLKIEVLSNLSSRERFGFQKKSRKKSGKFVKKFRKMIENSRSLTEFFLVLEYFPLFHMFSKFDSQE